MKKITVIAVIPGQKVHGENIVFPVSSAVKSIVLKEDTDVYISWFTEGDLLLLPSWVNESIHKKYWDNLKEYLLNSECSLLYLEPLNTCLKLQNESSENVSEEVSSFETLMKNSYFYEIERYEAMSNKIVSILDTRNDVVVVMYYSLAALFYMKNKNILDITYLEDTAPPSDSFHKGECYLQEMVTERYLSIKTIGEFIISKGDKKPDYIGSWDNENNGGYELYITSRQNEEVSGVIIDRLGYATFEGHFSEKMIIFIKKYSDESTYKTLSVPVPIEYDFSTNNSFAVETLGNFHYIYGEGHYGGTVSIRKCI